MDKKYPSYLEAIAQRRAAIKRLRELVELVGSTEAENLTGRNNLVRKLFNFVADLPTETIIKHIEQIEENL